MLLKIKYDYKELRKQAYPSIGDQLDAIWKGGDDAEKMKLEIINIKEKYPKSV